MEETLSLLHSPQPPSPKVILNVIISRLEDSPRRLVLVLDDYHRINDKVVHEALIYLLDHLPSSIHLDCQPGRSPFPRRLREEVLRKLGR
ncbi:MAG: hypothetical protein IPK19_05465 [Chloroflexi bacterium]|nr:hypothetical protein [Chloroflexota bacterium]